MNTCVVATFVMPDITKLAEKLSKSTNESFMIWHDALTKGVKMANEAKIDPDAFLMLIHNCTDSNQFLLIMETLNKYAKENPYGTNAFNLLDCFVEKSSYALKDWIESLQYFSNWLTQNLHQAKLPTMLDYITGCIHNNSQKELSFNLKDKVETILKTYGFQE